MPAEFRLDERPRAARVRRPARRRLRQLRCGDRALRGLSRPEHAGLFRSRLPGRELEVLGYRRQRIPSNWKLMIENIKDPYHASLLHVFLVTFGLFRLDQRSSTEIDGTGRHAVLVSRRDDHGSRPTPSSQLRNSGQVHLADPRLIQPVREFPGEPTVVMQTIWPNLIVQQQSNAMAMRQIVPRDAGNFDLAWTFFGYADDPPEMRERRLRQANLFGPAGLVSVDDSEAMLLSQSGINAGEDRDCIVEMDGREAKDLQHMITWSRPASLPASTLEKSRMSLITVSSASADIFTVFEVLALFGGQFGVKASSVMPRMPFMGVRISWLMLARNSLLARLAASAASWAARRSVMSWPEAKNTCRSGCGEAFQATHLYEPSLQRQRISNARVCPPATSRRTSAAVGAWSSGWMKSRNGSANSSS